MRCWLYPEYFQKDKAAVQQTRNRQGQTYLPRHPNQPDLFFYEGLAPVFATLLRNTSERESV